MNNIDAQTFLDSYYAYHADYQYMLQLGEYLVTIAIALNILLWTYMICKALIWHWSDKY